MMNYHFEFSIVIPTVTASSSLFELISSIEATETKNIQIIIVQNPPQKKILDWKNKFPNLHIEFYYSAAGVNNARNLGMSRARGEFIFFLDDDCKVDDPLLFVKHKNEHALNKNVFAVGGFYSSASINRIDEAYDIIQYRWLKMNALSVPGSCQVLLGGHFSIKNSESIPTFDPTISYGGSETEYFWRLGSLGYQFRLINCSILHSPGLTLSSFARKAFKQGSTHRRLAKTIALPPPHWIDTTLYKNSYFYFYSFCFDPAGYIKNYFRKNFRLIGYIKGALIIFHQKICFYLENRELF